MSRQSIYIIIWHSLCSGLLFFLPLSLSAQQENVWCFGDKAGIDFNGGPIAIKTAIKTTEGSASVCDDRGSLLFYTDGHQVWDKHHKLMPNGDNLPGQAFNMTFSTSQGAAIVPFPGDPDKYYIFSLAMDVGLSPAGKLYYSVVDMQRNAGSGDIIPDQKGVLVDSLLTEHMTTVTGPDCNVWLIVVDRIHQQFHAHNITVDGIQPNAAISPKMPPEGIFLGILGCLDISPDGKKLAIAQGNLYLYDFNPANGTLSNPLLLEKDISGSFYGVCFSPGNSKLYASTAVTLEQFDLSSGDPDTMAASRYTLSSSQIFPSIKRGPDKKVYIASNRASLHCIAQPEQAGLSSDYRADALPLLPDTRSELGLPNNIAVLPLRRQSSLHQDTIYCADSARLVAVHTDGRNYTWDDGYKNKDRYVRESGVYAIHYNRFNMGDCTTYIDSFHVVMIKNTFLSETQSIVRNCPTDTFWLAAPDTTAADYLWQDGYTAPGRMIRQSGRYTVQYSLAPCRHYTVQYDIRFPKKNPELAFQADSFACVGQLLGIRNLSPSLFNRFSWHFGDGGQEEGRQPGYRYRQPGIYQVMLTGNIDGHCADTAYQNITVDAPTTDYLSVLPDKICQGDAVLLEAHAGGPTVRQRTWISGDGTRSTSTATAIKHAYTESGLFPVTLITQFRACPDQEAQDTVQVFPVPVVDLGPDTFFCFRDAAIPLYNRHNQENPVRDKQWSTGAQTDTLVLKQAGTYALRISLEPLGCAHTESVTISQDCRWNIPNAFTPNGDGINDFFFPRPLPQSRLQQFTLQVWHRNGQLVYTTHSIGGQGWDGKFNSIEQPPGVYLYQVQAGYAGGNNEVLNGHVTLIR